MDRLISIFAAENIPPEYRNTPIGLLLEYHNLNRPLDRYTKACLLIGMCIDNRKLLRVPKNFGFIIRSAGANLKEFEFNVSYTIAIGEVNSIALIGHSNCGMVDLTAKKISLFTAWWRKQVGNQWMLKVISCITYPHMNSEM